MTNADWAKATLDNVLPIKYGKARNQNYGTPRNNVAVYGSSGVIDRFNRALTSKASLIIGRKGSVGEVYLSKEPCWPIDTTYYVEETTNVYLQFFYYRLRFFGLSNFDRSTAVPGLSRDDYNALILSLPSLNEQKEIVRNIEEIFSDLDNAVENLKRAQEQLIIYRYSVLSSLLTGKNQVKLGSLIDPPKYGTSRKCSKDSGRMPVLRIPNIGTQYLDLSNLKYADFSDEEIVTYSLREGDLLIIRSNGSVSLVGKVAIVSKKDVKALYAGYLIRLRPKAILNSQYAQYVLSSPLLRNQIELKARSTSGVHNINSDEIKNLDIPFCSLKEQLKIVDEIESRLSLCDQLEQTIELNLLKTESLRQSILKQAFDGKLTEQWRKDHKELISGDNSAQSLLRKIRTEHTELNGKTKKVKKL